MTLTPRRKKRLVPWLVPVLACALLAACSGRGDAMAPVPVAVVDSRAIAGDVQALARFVRVAPNEPARVRAAELLGDIGTAEAVPPLITAAKGGAVKVRIAAADALGSIGDARAIDVLLVALEAEDDTLRQTAARALGRIGDKRATAALAKRLRDYDPQVRRATAQALGRLGDPSAVDPLIAALTKRVTATEAGAVVAGGPARRQDVAALVTALGNLRDVQAVEAIETACRATDMLGEKPCLDALAAIGGEAAVSPLAKLLRHDEVSVRELARLALVKIADEHAVFALVDALSDPRPEVRVVAAKGVGFVGRSARSGSDRAKRVAALLVDMAAVTALQQGLRDSSPEVRAATVRALGDLGDATLAGKLKPLADDKDPEVRAAALGALWQTTGADAVPLLLKALDDLDDSLLQHAAWMLGEARDPRAVEPMLALLSAGKPAVRWSAAGALGQLGDRRATLPIAALLNDPDPRVAEIAARALAALGDPDALPQLSVAVNETTGPVRLAVIEALGQLGNSKMVRFLLPLLSDGDGAVQTATAQALRRLNNPGSARELARRLPDLSPRARVEVIETLGGFGGPVATKALLEVVNGGDETTAMRATAIKALGHPSFGGEAKVENALLARIADTQSELRAAAAGALGVVGGTKAVEPLRHRLRDPNRLVRETAAASLYDLTGRVPLDTQTNALILTDPLVRRVREKRQAEEKARLLKPKWIGRPPPKATP